MATVWTEKPTTAGHPPVACPNCPCGGPRIGGRGDPKSAIVAVGEAPGRQELKDPSRRPFVGPSGKLWQSSLPSGVDIDDVYTINAMECFIGTSQTKNKSRTERALLTCRNRMLEQIGEHPRKVILALGGYAAISVLGDMTFKITQRRGEVFEIDHPLHPEWGKIKVIPTFHPAYLLRGKGSLRRFKMDVAEAFALAGFKVKAKHGEGVRIAEKYVEPKHLILESAQDISRIDWMMRKEGVEKIAADVETSSLHWYNGELLCLGLYPQGFKKHPDTAFIIPDTLLLDREGKEATNRLLGREEGRKFIWQGGKFDLSFLWNAGINSARIDCDTLLLSYSLEETGGGHDLETLAMDLLGAPNWKGVLKQWAPKKTDSYANVPRPVLYRYLASDVKNTAGIEEKLWDQVSRDAHLTKLYTRTLVPAAPLLTRVEMTGMATDMAFVELNREELEGELEALDEQLRDIAGEYVNPNSPGEVRELLYDKMGLRVKGKRPETTRKEVLAKLKGNPAVDTIVTFRRVQKMLSTYVGAIERLRADDGRIHTTYSLTTTPTGRLASKEPNVQNIPRESRLRRMYCARGGCKLVEADYNTAELRMLAVLSRDEFLTGIFLDGKRSLHDEVSIEMYGVGFTPDQRIRAKAINFGIPYGREAFSVAEEFDMAVTEAQRLIDAWFNRAPGARDFLAQCARAPLLGQTLVTPFGRKRRPGVVSREILHELQNQFRNFFMQSIISDFCLHAGMAMQEDLQRIGAAVVNLVHDSLLVECPDEPATIRECMRIMKHWMEFVPTLWVQTDIRFTVDFKVGQWWGLLEKAKEG